MSWRQTFAKMIGVPEHQAEDALHSERAARATFTRRNLFAGGAALAAGSVFSFPTPAVRDYAAELVPLPFVSPFFAGPTVLENDLAGATMRADVENAPRLASIVQYLNMEAPSPCWGSREKVLAWALHFAQKGSARS